MGGSSVHLGYHIGKVYIIYFKEFSYPFFIGVLLYLPLNIIL